MTENDPGRRHIDIRVPVLARVEGEGALEIRARDGRIQQLQLRIFEPPRYFEKFLEGRSWEEVPDLVARICGICPVAYQMSAVQALEQAFATVPGAWVTRARRLIYCGEWIQSHALHIHLLALPDFLGFDNAIALAGAHPEVVRRGMDLQRLGNDLIRLFGGRSVHPVGVRVGGFHRAPDPEAAADLQRRLDQALPRAEELVAFLADLDLPRDDQDFISVALRHEREYPMYAGRIVSDHGLDIPVEAYAGHFTEEHRPHSTALYSRLHGRPYLVGPLARLNLNHDRLSPRAAAALANSGLRLPSRNMFHALLARGIELLQALEDAHGLLGNDAPQGAPHAQVSPRAGEGFGATEAPRGLLWHHYVTDGEGRVRLACIVPPTAQNQARMEEDLRRSLEAFGLHHDDDALRLRGEMVVRNYDPCISCATHFLKVRVDRDGEDHDDGPIQGMEWTRF